MSARHFIDLKDFDAVTLRALIDNAREMKDASNTEKSRTRLPGKTLAMIFEKNSTRTRVSFEAGMLQLGGHAIHLPRADLQLGRGESIADTARVLSRYVDAIMMRAYDHRSLLELAKYAEVPVINGLTDLSHPCQIMADILTFEEHRGAIQGRRWQQCLSFMDQCCCQVWFQLPYRLPRRAVPTARIYRSGTGAGRAGQRYFITGRSCQRG